MSCDSSVSHSITITLSLLRRQPGGLWNLVSQYQDTDPTGFRNYQAVITDIAFDCRKDYRTQVHGTASPGGHDSSIVSSPILWATC
jgi:hypothetical protein